MKSLIIILFALFSLNTFAKGFIKSDTGDVTWYIKKDTLIVPMSLYSNTIVTNGLSKEMEIDLNLWMQMVPFGYRGEYEVFYSKKENIEEKVKSLVKHKLQELFQLPYAHVEKSNTIELKEIECKRKGIIKRYTVCSAIYESEIEVELD